MSDKIRYVARPVLNPPVRRRAAGGSKAAGFWSSLFFICHESVYVNAQAMAVDSGITGL